MPSNTGFEREAAILAASLLGKMETITPAGAAAFYFQCLDGLVAEDAKRTDLARQEEEKRSGAQSSPAMVEHEYDPLDQ